MDNEIPNYDAIIVENIFRIISTSMHLLKDDYNILLHHELLEQPRAHLMRMILKECVHLQSRYGSTIAVNLIIYI